MGGFKPSAKSFKKSTSTAEAAVEATLATPFSSMFCTGTDDEGEENGGARGAKCGGGGGGGGGAISCAQRHRLSFSQSLHRPMCQKTPHRRRFRRIIHQSLRCVEVPLVTMSVAIDLRNYDVVVLAVLVHLVLVHVLDYKKSAVPSAVSLRHSTNRRPYHPTV